MNFISAIHTTAFTVLRKQHESTAGDSNKLLFEQICEVSFHYVTSTKCISQNSRLQNVPADKYIASFIELCKAFWSILVCYYQITNWHQNAAPTETSDTNSTHPPNQPRSSSSSPLDEYTQQKFRNGQIRLWNDIQSKCCVYLASAKLHQLKYEQFIQVLSIVQRLKKVGGEFCSGSGGSTSATNNEHSASLMEAVRVQSIAFFQRYHALSLEEICLFVDNEAWMPVASFSSVLQLQVRFGVCLSYESPIEFRI